MATEYWERTFGESTVEVSCADFITATIAAADPELQDSYRLLKTVRAPTHRELFGAAPTVTIESISALLSAAVTTYASADLKTIVAAVVSKYAATVKKLDGKCEAMLEELKAKGSDGLTEFYTAERALTDIQLDWLSMSKIPTQRFTEQLVALGAAQTDAAALAFKIFQDKRDSLPNTVSLPNKRDKATHAINNCDLVVDLRSCSLTATDAQSFAEKMVTENANVATSVDIGSNLLYAEGAEALATLIEGLPKLSTLRCGGGNIQLSGFEHVLSTAANAVETGTGASKLKTLDLSGSHGGPDCASVLCSLLPATKLECVCVSGNNIGCDRGANDIASTLSMTQRVTNFSAAANHFGDVGARIIAHGLQQNESLVSLDLRDNAIGDDGCSALAAAVSNHPTLSSLDLCLNKISVRGILALSTAAKENKGLFTVLLESQNISADITGEIEVVTGESEDNEAPKTFAGAVKQLTGILAENKNRFASFVTSASYEYNYNDEMNDTVAATEPDQNENKTDNKSRDACLQDEEGKKIGAESTMLNAEIQHHESEFQIPPKSARLREVEKWSIDDVLLWMKCAVRKAKAAECVAARGLDGGGLLRYSGVLMKSDGLSEEDSEALLECTATLLT